MPVDERYRRQVELLVRTLLAHFARERCFALKGGTSDRSRQRCQGVVGP